ncbi:MAG TPA: hypothetical protein VFQ44_11085 [Streptosporangiaceae bacterium]|nr:hypothetical protein [Streptosporangiaceae bacterium]
MAGHRSRLAIAAAVLTAGWSLAMAQEAVAQPHAAHLAAAPAADAGSHSGQACIGRHPNTGIYYAAACSGHDEPEIDPVSALAGSAQDLTWTVILPQDGTVPVSAVGPTFWFGGALSNPNPKALFGQAFLELQFYPDAIVSSCSSTGGYSVTMAQDKFSACAPAWQVNSKSNAETAAFNAELFNGSSKSALVMNGGDTVQIHFFMTSASQAWNVKVSDLTTGQSGTIVLNSKFGPLQPLFSTQQIGNSLGWGLVNDTPDAFVWEIGHTSNFAMPAAQTCTAGQTKCDSYDTSHWLGFTPIKIVSVTFADGSAPSEWATVSDLGGTAEVSSTCPTYGVAFCTYPWYAFNGAANAITYGADYPGTQFDYGQAAQFSTTQQCGGPFGADTTYCDTILSPTP